MPNQNKKNSKNELKKELLDAFFNPREQRRAIEHAVRESAKDQRRVMERYEQKMANKAAT